MVTSRLLEAFLACPVKCYLLSKGEVPAGTEYSTWAAAREESYRRESVRKLTSQETGPDIASAEPGIWKHESWPFAIGRTVRTENWEAEIALIQRITHVGDLLKRIVETVDRRGLKTRFLRKHFTDVETFFGFLDASQFASEAASTCKQRFLKNRVTLFTFLQHDGVPWNNNNAEHAIKAFARLRDVIAGSSSRKGVDEYLTLLSVAESCEYRGIDFLDFLRSEDRDVDTFAKRRKRTRGNRTIPM